MSSPDAIPPGQVTLAALAHTFDLEVQLARGVRDESSLQVAVRGVSLDNRTVVAGDLFAGLPGAKTHGARYVRQAQAQGAIGVLTDTTGAAELAGVDIPVLVAPDPRAALGAIAAQVHRHPADRLNMYAVTGTNGKTTTTYLLEHILAELGRITGLVGTVELKVGPDRTPARLTTPEAPALHALLAQMEQAAVDDVVMEVSSHALALHRVDGVQFDVVGLTNLTQDHLDFHGDLEHYYLAKASLFSPERARRGVVMVDDEWGRRLAGEAPIDVVTVSATGQEAHWQARPGQRSAVGTTFELVHRDGRTLSSAVALPGDFNVANAALALVMAIEAGAGIADITRALPEGLTAAVPGRMELIASAPRVLVDFAHNTEALREALAAVRAGTAGRLFVIFGATGERDTGKRTAMGAAAVEGADVVVITDDDPHDEDPATIRRQVMTGALAAMTAAQREGRSVDVYEVAPRQAAIARVVRFAGAADTVLVAGRGHETWQEIAGVDHHLDDRAEVRIAMAEREQRRADPAGPR